MKKLFTLLCFVLVISQVTLAIVAEKGFTLVPIYSLLLSNSTTNHKVNVITTDLTGTGLSFVLNSREEISITSDGTSSFSTVLKNFS